MSEPTDIYTRTLPNILAGHVKQLVGEYSQIIETTDDGYFGNYNGKDFIIDTNGDLYIQDIENPQYNFITKQYLNESASNNQTVPVQITTGADTAGTGTGSGSSFLIMAALTAMAIFWRKKR